MIARLDCFMSPSRIFSMSDFNPYAAPKADLHAPRLAGDGMEIWRDNKVLVMTKGAVLPDRCLKCNAPAEGYRLRRKLSWHPSAYYLIILINLILYVIVALIVRYTAKAEFPLCPIHRRRRRWGIINGWLLALLGFATLFGGAVDNDHAGYYVFGGLVLVVAGLVYGLVRSQIPRPSKIDKSFVWLKGVSPRFLAELPNW